MSSSSNSNNINSISNTSTGGGGGTSSSGGSRICPVCLIVSPCMRSISGGSNPGQKACVNATAHSVP